MLARARPPRRRCAGAPGLTSPQDGGTGHAGAPQLRCGPWGMGSGWASGGPLRTELEIEPLDSCALKWGFWASPPCPCLRCRGSPFLPCLTWAPGAGAPALSSASQLLRSGCLLGTLEIRGHVLAASLAQSSWSAVLPGSQRLGLRVGVAPAGVCFPLRSECAGVALPTDHTVGRLNHGALFSSSPGAQRSEVKVWQGLGCDPRSRGHLLCVCV